MSNKLILKEDGLTGLGNPPSGYKYLGDSSGVVSEKSGGTVSYIADPNLTQVVNISSAQILSLGSSPITLLSAPGNNKYYDIKKVIIEYTYGGTPYALNTQLAVIFGSGFSYYISRVPYALITLTQNAVCVVSGFVNQDILSPNPLVPAILPLNQPVLFRTADSNNPLNGNGTLRLVVEYQIKTFGA